MLEIVIAICATCIVLGLLAYLYLVDKEQHQYIKKLQDDLTNMPADLQRYYMNLASADNKQTQRTLEEAFTKFLRHIEKLERMTLPKPVTTRDVQSVMNRMGEVVDESLEAARDNEIEKEEDKGIELPKDEWTGYINAETKVAFEGEEVPTVIE